MGKTQEKQVCEAEARALAERSTGWTDKCKLDGQEIPDSIAGVQKMPGYVGTFYSGSFGSPEGRVVGSFDAIREDVRYRVGENGRVKKYQYKVFVNEQEDPLALTVQERPKKTVKGHHSPELEDEFWEPFVQN